MTATENSTNGNIDERLFIPLSKFLMEDNTSLDDLENLISGKGFTIPIEHTPDKAVALLRHFVLKAYIAWAFSRYTGRGQAFTTSRYNYLKHPYGYLSMDKWGGIHFHDLGNEEIRRIDALWELQNHTQTTPIIFGVTFERDTFLGVKEKRDLVSEIYSEESFFCKIRPAIGNEDLGLYNQGDDYYRKILIPPKKFGRVAWGLWNSMDGKNQKR